ncbi:MAG: putative component of anaerobic dehydrogenase, partial [Neobacillus sp.]|nr:putative component of anaerobic dehydrogenase [Neobacillus sp.]
ILADLYKYPDMEIWQDIKSFKLFNKLKEYESNVIGAESTLEITELPEELRALQEIYSESLGKVLPVESVYKEWTADRTCQLPFARSKGYLVGDSALHIHYILEKFAFEIPEEFRNMPDHLSILLELLGYFISHGNKELAVQFLADHFDWLGDFEDSLREQSENQFYLQITRYLRYILDTLKRLPN